MRCLKSLKNQISKPSEIIVVDSSDTSLKSMVQFNTFFKHHNFERTALHYIHSKPGLTYQRNVGIQKASGDIIYFFDDDVELRPDYLFEMQQIFLAYPRCLAGMGSIRNVGSLSLPYRLFRKIFLLQRTYSSGTFTFSGMPTHPYGTNNFQYVEALGGCCMAFRASALQDERFDEMFHGYCFMEDADIARRISAKGPLFFNPRAQLDHFESPVARDKIYDVSRMFIMNYRYLFFKNFYNHNIFKRIAYWWSLCGLLLEASILRDWQRLSGYWNGITTYKRGVL